MRLRFITSSKEKCEEARLIIPYLEHYPLNLPEIQEIDARAIIKAKLNEALYFHQGHFIVEDTSLYCDALKGLPGPLAKWFGRTIGFDGLAKLTSKLGDLGAEAKTIIGYAKNPEECFFFEGVASGIIVLPRGNNAFGWDQIFQPGGCQKTFGEMSRKEKNAISMRRIAFEKLKAFLEKHANDAR